MSKPKPLFKRAPLRRAANKGLRTLLAHIFLKLVRGYQMGDHSFALTHPLWYMYKDPCVYCSGVAETWDHLLPRAKYRQGEPGNKAPCCRKCNVRKGPTTALEFLLRKSREERYCPEGHPKETKTGLCRVCVATRNRGSALRRLVKRRQPRAGV